MVGEEAQLKWRGVKFPEYRNSISGYFHLKRAALISICGLGGGKYVRQSQTTNIRLVEYEDVNCQQERVCSQGKDSLLRNGMEGGFRWKPEWQGGGGGGGSSGPATIP